MCRRSTVIHEFNSDRPSIEVLDRYLAGESSPDEQREVEIWLERNSSADEFLSVMTAVDRSPEVTKDAQQGHELLERSWERVRPRPVVESRDLPMGVYWSRHIPKIAWVMGVALFAVVAFLGLTKISPDEERDSGNYSGQYAVYSTRAGERTTVTLADGTTVSLNVATTLEVPRDFGAGSRNVRLIGHAVFDVINIEGEPFIIDALGTRTAVLGTRFSVRAYEPNVQLTVQSGKVSFGPCNSGESHSCNATDRQVVLAANESAVINEFGELSALAGGYVEREMAFTSGKLTLYGSALSDVIPSLERWYDVEIHLADQSLGDLAFAGTFPAGNVENLIQALSVVFGINVKREGNIMTLYRDR